MIKKILDITSSYFDLIIFLIISFSVSILELISTAMLISLADFIQYETITVPEKNH